MEEGARAHLLAHVERNVALHLDGAGLRVLERRVELRELLRAKLVSPPLVLTQLGGVPRRAAADLGHGGKRICSVGRLRVRAPDRRRVRAAADAEGSGAHLCVGEQRSGTESLSHPPVDATELRADANSRTVEIEMAPNLDGSPQRSKPKPAVQKVRTSPSTAGRVGREREGAATSGRGSRLREVRAKARICT